MVMISSPWCHGCCRQTDTHILTHSLNACTHMISTRMHKHTNFQLQCPQDTAFNPAASGWQAGHKGRVIHARAASLLHHCHHCHCCLQLLGLLPRNCHLQDPKNKQPRRFVSSEMELLHPKESLGSTHMNFASLWVSYCWAQRAAPAPHPQQRVQLSTQEQTIPRLERYFHLSSKAVQRLFDNCKGKLPSGIRETNKRNRNDTP